MVVKPLNLGIALVAIIMIFGSILKTETELWWPMMDALPSPMMAKPLSVWCSLSPKCTTPMLTIRFLTMFMGIVKMATPIVVPVIVENGEFHWDIGGHSAAANLASASPTPTIII